MPSDAEISALPEANPVDGAFTVVGVQAGVTKRATLAVVQEGIVPIFSRSTTLTDAQIKALPTTPVELVPAPGAGKLVSCVEAYIFADITSAYTGIDAGAYFEFLPAQCLSIVMNDSSESVAYVTGLLTATSGLRISPPFYPIVSWEALLNSFPFQDYANEAILMSAQNNLDFTGGNAANTLKVTVLYSIIDV